jgi:hypothetical protein
MARPGRIKMSAAFFVHREPSSTAALSMGGSVQSLRAKPTYSDPQKYKIPSTKKVQKIICDVVYTSVYLKILRRSIYNL